MFLLLIIYQILKTIYTFTMYDFFDEDSKEFIVSYTERKI